MRIFDIFSFVMGFIKGKSHVVMSGDSYTFADDGQGNVTITEV